MGDFEMICNTKMLIQNRRDTVELRGGAAPTNGGKDKTENNNLLQFKKKKEGKL